MSETTLDISAQIDDMRLLKMAGWRVKGRLLPKRDSIGFRRRSTSITQVICRFLISIQRNRVVFKRSGR